MLVLLHLNACTVTLLISYPLERAETRGWQGWPRDLWRIPLHLVHRRKGRAQVGVRPVQMSLDLFCKCESWCPISASLLCPGCEAMANLLPLTD